jgi:hypothetical protein
MRHLRERDFEEEAAKRDQTAKGPLYLEPVANLRSARTRYILPIAAIVCIVGLFLFTGISRYATWMSGGLAPSPTPWHPTPLPWIDDVVSFSLAASPSASSTAGATASAVPSPSPSAVPSEAPSESAGPSASPTPLFTSLRAEVPDTIYFWNTGVVGHFTLALMNTSDRSVSLADCPTYRMYVSGTDASLATVRRLNCAAIGPTLIAGTGVELDMVYRPSATDGVGPQTLVWELVSPSTLQAQTLARLYISP